MSQDADARLLAAFEDSVVTVHLPAGDVLLSVGDPPPADVPTPAGIITAMNPRQGASATANAEATTALHALLHRQNLTHTKTVSQAKDGCHQEHGFLVTGVTQDKLRQFAQAFGQLAVYWVTAETVQVVACD